MWENLACVGEINYSSTFLEGVASIITRQAFTSTTGDPPPHTSHGSAERITCFNDTIEPCLSFHSNTEELGKFNRERCEKNRPDRDRERGKLYNEQYQRLKIATPSREELSSHVSVLFLVYKKHVDIIMVKLYNLRARFYYSW